MHVREDAVLGLRSHNLLRSVQQMLMPVAKVALAPGVGMAVDIDAVSGVVAALDLETVVHLAVGADVDLLREVAGLLVSLAQLTVDVEAPSVKVTTLSEGSTMAETSRAGDNVVLLVCLLVDNGDLLWQSDLPLLAKAKLAHFSLSPAEEFAVSGDG